MTWFGYALLSVLFSAALGLMLRVLSFKSDDPRAFGFVYNVIAGLIAALIFLPQVSFGTVWVSGEVWLLMLLAVLLYGVFERSQFAARKHIEASSYSILSRMSPVITFVGSIALLGESLTVWKLVGATLIIGANLVLSYKKGALSLDENWRYMVVPILASGLVRVVDKVVTGSFKPELYSVVLWVAPVVLIYLPSIPMRSIRQVLGLGWWKIALAALVNVLAFYYLLKAFEVGEASSVVMVSSMSTVLVVVAGVVFLRERSRLVQKLVAALVAVVGVLLLR